jgi:hypothetical protein
VLVLQDIFSHSRLAVSPCATLRLSHRGEAFRQEGTATLGIHPCVGKVNRGARLVVRSPRAHLAGGTVAVPLTLRTLSHHIGCSTSESSVDGNAVRQESVIHFVA